MNLLIFEENELRNSKLLLQERRAEHIINVLGAGVDDSVRVGMLGGNTGIGRIVSIVGNSVELVVELTNEQVQRPEIDLILALPRPIMLQRILKQATVLGVRSFHLIRSRRVEKSFFQSPVLHSEKMKQLLIEGLEQAMDTCLPEVHIHTRFKPFMEDVVPHLSASNRLIAHPSAADTLRDCMGKRRGKEGIILAVGPEGGWSDFETDCFIQHGFCRFTMGPRILHVDTAVVALLAQLLLVQDFLNR